MLPPQLSLSQRLQDDTIPSYLLPMFAERCAHGHADWHACDVMIESKSCLQVHREVSVLIVKVDNSQHHSCRLAPQPKRPYCLYPAVLAIGLLLVHNTSSVTLHMSRGLLVVSSIK